MEEATVSVLKAEEGGLSNAVPTTEDDLRIFTQYGAVLPPYEPRMLVGLYERSDLLRPCVDAYVTNIEGFGHRLEPTVDLQSDGARDAVRDALILERLSDASPIPDVSEEDVDAALMMLPARLRIERLRLERWFDNACAESSFVELRRRTRQDLEVTGNAYWEVVRDALGRPVQLVLVPAISVRLLRVDPSYSASTELRRVSALGYRRTTVHRRYRRFVQVIFGQFVAYFKEFGDERVVSSKTGVVYDTAEALRAHESGARPATEMIHFRVPWPTTAYGVPRWVGTTPIVTGTRASEEVNSEYFDNKAMGDYAILVSGGTLARGASEKITQWLKDHKGREAFGSVLVIEAESTEKGAIAAPGMQGSRIRVEFKQIAGHEEGLWLEYQERGADKVGKQFRLPKILRGDSADVNRATADAALRYAEQQVFAPERDTVDFTINRLLMPALGARFHEFVSNTPVAKDSETLAKVLVQMQDYATADELRGLAADVCNVELPKRDEDAWARFPPGLLKAGVVGPGADGGPPGSLPAEAKRLVKLRAALAEAEGRAGEAALSEARKTEAEKVVRVPAEEFRTWFEPN